MIDGPLDVLRRSEKCLQLEKMTAKLLQHTVFELHVLGASLPFDDRAIVEPHDVPCGSCLTGHQLLAEAMAAFEQRMVLTSGGRVDGKRHARDGRIDHRLHEHAD